MQFGLTDEQQMFQQVIRKFVDAQIRPVAHDWEASGRYPTEIVNGFRELGLFGLTVPEQYGGLGADTVTLALVFEELAQGWMGVAGVLGSHTLSCRMIALHGTDAQRDQLLPDLAAGRRRTGIALTEPGAGSDLRSITTRAVRDGDGYVLNGTKTWITNARHADPLPVLAKLAEPGADGPAPLCVFLVPADTTGFSVSRDLSKLGYKGTETCEVLLEDVRVPREALLGEAEGRGLKQALSSLEVGRINVAARAVGVAQAAYDAAFEYAGQRQAFGSRIADFQAIQLKLADMATQIQSSRLLTWWAAARMDSGQRADVEAGMAKYQASEVALKATLEAMRIHGAYGYSTEFDVERLYRDAPLMAIGEGTNDILRMVIAKGLRARAEGAAR
jgi:alkylation response protein AidB-like acyl-CoA dehydrogenase